MSEQVPAVVLLAGGASSRFYPLSASTHKSFIQICGKPLIAHTLEDLQRSGFHSVVLVLSPRDYAEHTVGSFTQEYKLDQLDLQIVLQPEPKGQADAIFKASQHLEHPENLLVASPYHTGLGEILTALWESHQKSNVLATLLGAPTEQPHEYGILQVDGQKVTGIQEKPASTAHTNQKTALRALSCYCLNKQLISSFENSQEHYSLEKSVDAAAKDGRVEWIKNTTPLTSLKYAWQLLHVTETILKNTQSSTASSAQVAKTASIDDSQGPVVIDEYAQIKDFAKIAGPAYIGTGVLVGEHCFVRGSSIEHNTVVGSYSEIVRSVLLSGVSIHQGYCSDSILGENTQVGAGLITANLRLDHQPVKITLRDKNVQTQRRKLGVITGEGVHIGVRVTTMPGILVGAGATIFPGNTVFTSIGENQVVKSSKTKGCTCQT
ncbi:MAG: sugar phosphate nucleotidyltransferase [Patescibacteria group bacterium]